ncbi:hypothetical protein [Streptomyces sp. NPDC058664]|uniref:hypothetical protein n=1 Tax=unclassified Streptomyces TaxID=2593676 RepID=UPI003664D75A
MTVPEESRHRTDAVDEAVTGPGRTSPAERKNQGEPGKKDQSAEPGSPMREAPLGDTDPDGSQE